MTSWEFFEKWTKEVGFYKNDQPLNADGLAIATFTMDNNLLKFVVMADEQIVDAVVWIYDYDEEDSTDKELVEFVDIIKIIKNIINLIELYEHHDHKAVDLYTPLDSDSFIYSSLKQVNEAVARLSMRHNSQYVSFELTHQSLSLFRKELKINLTHLQEVLAGLGANELIDRKS